MMCGLNRVTLIAASPADAPAIIALTGHQSEAIRQRCLDAGIAGFLTKPIEKDALEREIARLDLARRRRSER